MAVEFELKYGATPEILEQLQMRYAGEEKTYRMRTTYYDTPTEQFSARHCTLRCRLENEVSVCTLKMPTGGIGLKNLATYAACPVICACGGSYMVTADLIENGKWDEITELCKKSVEIVKEARK